MNISHKVINTKIQASVYKNARNRYSESSIQAFNSLFLICFSKTIIQTFKLSLRYIPSQINSQPCSGKIQWMNEKCSSHSSKSSIPNLDKEKVDFILLCLLFKSKQTVKVFLKRKTKRLGWEVSDYIYPIASPQRNDSFLSKTSHEAIHSSFIRLSDPRILSLSLHEQFDSLNWSHYRFRDDTCNTAREKIFNNL